MLEEKSFFVDEGWKEIFVRKKIFEKPYMKNIQNFLTEQKRNEVVFFPPEEFIFNAFCQTPYDKVKVVIMGQDPYHGVGQAHGLSFSVQEKIPQPPSLKNIFKEMVEDVGITFPKSGNLLPWSKQGVLLLNAILTVEKSKPMSHSKIGWEEFTDDVLEVLFERDDPLVFLLWGKAAQNKCFKVFNKKKNHNHLILTAAHPSFYSVAGFWGCRHFSKTNAFLKKFGKKPIDWQI